MPGGGYIHAASRALVRRAASSHIRHRCPLYAFRNTAAGRSAQHPRALCRRGSRWVCSPHREHRPQRRVGDRRRSFLVCPWTVPGLGHRRRRAEHPVLVLVGGAEMFFRPGHVLPVAHGKIVHGDAQLRVMIRVGGVAGRRPGHTMVALPGSSLFTVSTGASSSRTKDCSSCCNSAHCSGGKHWLCRTASRTADRAQARTGWMRACVCASGQEAWASSATNHANARRLAGDRQTGGSLPTVSTAASVARSPSVDSLPEPRRSRVSRSGACRGAAG